MTGCGELALAIQRAAFITARAISWQGLVSSQNRSFAHAPAAQAAINIKFVTCSGLYIGLRYWSCFATAHNTSPRH
jgi:hypothetical protein